VIALVAYGAAKHALVEGYARKVYGSIPHVVVTLTW